jgi:hypothetical protein
MRALLAFVPVACLVAACSATPDASTEETSSDAEPNAAANAPAGEVDPQAWWSSPFSYGSVPAWPVKTPQYCGNVDPSCSLYPTYGSLTNAQLASFGCAPLQRWWSGYSAGWLGADIALCTDSLALRAHFGDGAFNWMKNACDRCIPHAPHGQVWILLTSYVGPNCQSGCRSRNEGGW